MYFAPMIQAGMIYKAIPPLYSVKINGKDKYFIDNLDMIKFNQKIFSQKYQVSIAKNKILSSKELTLFFIRNSDYIYYLDAMADTYAIEHQLFEDILISYVENNEKINFNKLEKTIKSKYRFIDVTKESNIVTVHGVITKSNIAILTDKFFNDCINIIRIMKSNDYLHYNINGKSMSIYEIMKLYEKTQPNGVHRYKGLGETSQDILEKAVMSPFEDRILVQYTVNDMKEALSTIREYESDRKKILSLVGNITRDDLIE